MMRALWLALQLLTRLPTPAVDQISPLDQGRSVVWYPWVGALMGVVLAAAHTLLAEVAALLAAALLLLVWVLLSGALHLDGLADSADAWLGGRGERERALAIMKDPYTGPAGVTAVVVVLLVKFSAIASLPPGGMSTVLCLAPLLGRAAVVALFLTTPYVRPGGLGAMAAENLPRHWGCVSVLAAVLVAALSNGVVAVMAVAVVFLLLRRMMLTRLGGTTGDTAGAMIEIVEMTVLVAWLMV